MGDTFGAQFIEVIQAAIERECYEIVRLTKHP